MNPKQVWQAVLGELQLQISPQNYETWLKNTRLSSSADGTYVIAVPTTFAKEWIEARLMKQIKKALRGVVGRSAEVSVVVSPVGSRRKASGALPLLDVALEEEPVRSDPGGDERAGATSSAASSANATSYGVNGWEPNPKYTFAAFVVGGGNRMAHAAAVAVAASPARAYNPLFLYGGVGLGKTHLLHAIAHEVLRRQLKVIYVPSETFTNDLINAIRERRTDEFRGRYRSADVLLIDDIQFIAGKESTQEEFFHTFNTLHEASKQIVVSSDRPPKSIVTLEERLRSRFEWGLIADIKPPDFETRMAILQMKARGQPRPVPGDVLEFVARKVQRNIRELEGALNRIVAYAQVNGRPLTPEVAEMALSDIVTVRARRSITPTKIIEAVGRHYRVDVRALRGKHRAKDVVLPRQVVMFLMREETDLSLVDIGRELGGRDHTTVLHGYEKMRAEIDADAELRTQVLAIKEELYGEAR